MNPVRGVTGKRDNYITSDGKKWPRLAFANAHQRGLNGAARMRKLAAQFKLGNGKSEIDPDKLTAALRENPLFRKRFMLAVHY
jgi:hypothetical protein